MAKKKKAKTKVRKVPSQSRAKATVKFITDATVSLLEIVGYEKASTNKIAEKAGVSIGSLYQYFPSKESIVDHLVDEYINKHYEALVSKLHNAKDLSLDDIIKQVLAAFVAMFEKRRKLRVTLLKNLPKNVMPKIYKAEDDLQKVIAEKLEERKDEIKRTDFQLASYIIIQTVAGSLRGSLAEERKLNMAKLEDEIFIFSQKLFNRLNSFSSIFQM